MASSSLDPFRLAFTEPSWDDLRIFLAVVAHGSMNSAAKALGQSQPTIARRIKVLEETLGISLFQRGPNNLDLTEAGQAVYEATAPMGDAAAIVSRTAAAYRPDPDAPVRITATASVTLFLSLHSTALHEAASPVEIAYIPTRQRLDLASGEADIGLRMRSLPEGTDDLVARKIGQIAFAMYARTENPKAVIAPPEDPTSCARRPMWPSSRKAAPSPPASATCRSATRRRRRAWAPPSSRAGSAIRTRIHPGGEARGRPDRGRLPRHAPPQPQPPQRDAGGECAGDSVQAEPEGFGGRLRRLFLPSPLRGGIEGGGRKV